MARNAPVTERDPPELTDEQLARLRPTREVLNPEQYAAVIAATGRGRPKAEQAKVPVTIRLDRDVVEAFKATGKGWQTRVNAALAEAAPKLASPDRASGGGGTRDAKPRATNAKKRA